MRTLIAWVFNYSIDGLLADPDTPFWDFCFGPGQGPPAYDPQLGLYRSADVHLFGRRAYESISASASRATDHPFVQILNPARKVVVSQTLTSASWENTTVASGNLRDEMERLRDGGDGPIVVWGGVTLWRSLVGLDLLDELHLDLYPFVSGKGTRLFDQQDWGYRLELVGAHEQGNGLLDLHYRRRRQT